jgi:hypothetical protein
MQRPPLGLAVVVAALTPISLVLAHNLVFLLAYGEEAGAVLRATGHDQAWVNAVQLVLACSAALGGAALARILVLWRTARRLERETGRLAHTGWRGFGGLLLRAWAGVALVTTVWFLVQENVERLSIGEPAPLFGPLLEGGPVAAVVVVAAVSLAAALVGSLFRWGVASLLARIAAARQPRRRLRPVPGHRPTGRIVHPSALLARHLGLRAPPPVLVD